MNLVVLAGNLGRDAETKFTPGGASVTTFSVATTRNVKRGENWEKVTDWHNVTAWQKEKLAQYLVKGAKVCITGRLETQTYDDKDGKKVYRTHVVADQIELMGSRNGSDEGSESGGGREHAPQSGGARASGGAYKGRGPGAAEAGGRDEGSWDSNMGITDDDVPF
jgi:single-strand DNA-binding protein